MCAPVTWVTQPHHKGKLAGGICSTMKQVFVAIAVLMLGQARLFICLRFSAFTGGPRVDVTTIITVYISLCQATSLKDTV